jgi:hypothetical protein
MQAREMVELAALASSQGPSLMQGSGTMSATGVEQYWAASRCRLERWGRSLKTLRTGNTDEPKHGRRAAQLTRGCGVLEEILTSEVLTRVWAAVLTGYDRCHTSMECEPIGRSILVGHVEARNRALKILVEGPGINSEEAVALNRLRQRAERWTDLLVGHLGIACDLSEFAHDPVRAREFSTELVERKDNRHVWALVLASLRAAFRQGLSMATPNADSNARIGASVMACLSADMFDCTGMLPSLWITRLTNTTTDAEFLIADLFTDDAKPVAEERHSPVYPRAVRRRFEI